MPTPDLPFAITGATGTDANGKPTATASITVYYR
jgi:hypothetical protein